MIKSGYLKPGHRFPSTKELAKQWDTYPLLVHKALRSLCEEGLVERQHNVGTFVRRDESVLSSSLIYLGTDIMHGKHLDFIRAVHFELVRILKADGVRVLTLLDPRGDEFQDIPWTQMVDLFAKKEYQTLIALVADEPRMKWIGKIPVATVRTCNVEFNWFEFAEKAVLSLKEKGCRSLGVISNLPRDTAYFHAPLREAFTRNGFEFREEWIKCPSKQISRAMFDAYGYEQTISLWRSKPCPDGIVVYPDSLMPGIISAMLHESIHIPQDLKLSIHKNRELDLLCPFPASFIVSGVADYAATMIALLRQKLLGDDTPTPKQIGFSVEDNPWPSFK